MKLITTTEAAQILNVPAITVARWCRMGYIKSVRFGDRFAIDANDLNGVKRPKAGRRPKATAQ